MAVLTCSSNHTHPDMQQCLPLPHRHLHIRRFFRWVSQSGAYYHSHDLPRLPMAPRAAVPVRPSAGSFLRSSPRGGSLLRLHHVPRRRSPTRINRRKHVHAATGLGPSIDSLFLRAARKRRSHLHHHGIGRLRKLAPRRWYARLHHRPRRDSNKHGLILAYPRLLQPSPRPWSTPRCSCCRLPNIQLQCVELLVDMGRMGGSHDRRLARSSDVRSLHLQGRREPCQLQLRALAK